MPTSADGIIAATFEPDAARVQLVVDGGMWPGTVRTLTLTRTVPGYATVPVRGFDQPRRTAGGWYLGSDHEFEGPLGSDVTYTVTGYDAAGARVGSASVTVSTAGTEWGVWLKAPGRPELTIMCPLVSVTSRSITDQGGEYQVHGGDAVSQSSGVNAEHLQLVVATRTPGEAAALRTLYERATARTLLVQTAEPEECTSGWYRVASLASENPAQVRSDVYARRVHTLALTRVAMPAGVGVAFAGTIYESVRQAHPTYQAIKDLGLGYADLARGA
jgi:hypothetical protein